MKFEKYLIIWLGRRVETTLLMEDGVRFHLDAVTRKAFLTFAVGWLFSASALALEPECIVNDDCDDGLGCTTDTCNVGGLCEHTVQAGTCAIDGECFLSGAKDGFCLECKPLVSKTQWTYVVGAICDDGDPCTAGDNCSYGGTSNADCLGSTYSCDDGLSCTTDSCNGDGTCNRVVAEGMCYISESCVYEGQKNGACEVCRPSLNNIGWTYVASTVCNDANPCTYNDICKVDGTGCGGTAYSCNDGISCTTDACSGDGTCTNVVQNGFCRIGTSCIPEGNSAGMCFECRPENNNKDWTYVVGKTCNDGVACTHTDVCRDGYDGDVGCGGTTYTCNDGIECTKDSCDGTGDCDVTALEGICVIDGVCLFEGAKDGPCLVCDPDSNQWEWTFSTGTTCNDGDPCTYNDICKSPEVGPDGCAGTTYLCDDSLECTLDVCKGDGSCAYTMIDGWCRIGGACIQEGTANGECFECKPLVNVTNWTYVSGRSCDDGDLCTVDDQCSLNGSSNDDCIGVAAFCNDHNICTDDYCDPAIGCTVSYNSINCDDGSSCTEDDQCVQGTCVGTTIECVDDNPCTNDGCDARTGCIFEPNFAPCEDDDVCTTTKCSDGECLVTLWKDGCCHEHEDCGDSNKACNVATNVCRAVTCYVCESDQDCGIDGNRCWEMYSGRHCVVGCRFEGDECPTGTSCKQVDQITWICMPLKGDCECIEKAEQDCSEGNLFWIDSCGAIGDLVTDCQGRGCAADKCCSDGWHEEGGKCIRDGSVTDSGPDDVPDVMEDTGTVGDTGVDVGVTTDVATDNGEPDTGDEEEETPWSFNQPSSGGCSSNSAEGSPLALVLVGLMFAGLVALRRRVSQAVRR